MLQYRKSQTSIAKHDASTTQHHSTMTVNGRTTASQTPNDKRATVPISQSIDKNTSSKAVKVARTTTANVEPASTTAKSSRTAHNEPSHAEDPIYIAHEAAACFKEIAITTCQLVVESWQALEQFYEVTTTLAVILVHTCKSAWTVGRLTWLAGECLYDMGKGLWKRLAA